MWDVFWDSVYGRQELLWQKQVTVIGSIDLDSQIDEYHTAVAQFQHAVCHRSFGTDFGTNPVAAPGS